MGYDSYLEFTVYFRLDKLSLLRSGPVGLGTEGTGILWGVNAVGYRFDFSEGTVPHFGKLCQHSTKLQLLGI